MGLFFSKANLDKTEFKDNLIELNVGEMCVVPKGTEHRPICTSEVICLLIEKEGTLTSKNTGGTYKL